MMKKMKPRSEALLVLFILTSLILLVVSVVFQMEVPPWEIGRPIPNQPPAEDRRVDNDSGFSIVVPPHWNEKHLDDRTILSPQQSIPSRSRAMIVVQPWHEVPPDLSGSQPTELAGRPAHLKFEQRRSTLDDPALTTWRYFFQHQGNWFEVSYSIAAARDEIPPMAKQYLETLKFDDDP